MIKFLHGPSYMIIRVFSQSVVSSDEDTAIEINLNINLNEISKGTDEIEIFDDSKSIMKSRSISGKVKTRKQM